MVTQDIRAAETTSPRAGSFPWDGRRDPVVDLIRGVAVVCMLIAHVRVWAPVTSEAAKIALVLINNIASPLFALVMGISAGIVLTRREGRVATGAFVVRNAVRGLILIAIGLLLVQLGTFVAIVLMSLDATLIIAAPWALLPVPALAIVAVTTFVAGPYVNALARQALDPARVYSTDWLDQVLQWLVLSTHYRAVSLLPFVLAGVLLARLRLTRRAAFGSLAVGLPAACAVVALRLSGSGLGVSEIVSGDLPDSLLYVALTASACGVIVLLARWAPMRRVVVALEPIRGAGALALTAYVLHVALIALAMRSGAPGAPYENWILYGGGILAATVLACWCWWRLLGKGPVERLMGMVTDRIR